MSLPSNTGGRYLGPETQYPYDDLPIDTPSDNPPVRAEPSPRLPYDNVEPIDVPKFRDPRFRSEENRNPDKADAGPLYMTPEAEQWYEENVIQRGWGTDWGAGMIMDEHGNYLMPAPRYFPKMA